MGRFSLKYYTQVRQHDLPLLDHSVAIRIHKAITQKLDTENPVLGFPLRYPLASFWKLRVGDYRIVYRMVASEIHIVAIAHRTEVYKLVTKRI